MEWHSNLFPLSAESSFICNLEPYPGMEVKQPEMMMERPSLGVDKKKKMTSEQVESLEKSFKEEIRPGSEQKMKLVRELGLHPRQVAVWFQNRRARQKVKQLECSYDSLKLEFDAVSREKESLQDEVLKLRAMLDQSNHYINTKQVSNEVTGAEKAVESMSATTATTTIAEWIPGGRGESMAAQQPPQQSGIGECHDYLFSGIDDFKALLSSPLAPYWAAALPP